MPVLTVEDLIEKLKKLPLNRLVFTEGAVAAFFLSIGSAGREIG